MRAVSLAAVIVAVGVPAACSSNTPPPEQSSPSVAPTGHGGFAHCLTEHGMPAPPGPAAGPPPGVDQTTWHRAMEACSSMAPGPAG